MCSSDLGALVAFLQYSSRFFRPISDMSEKFNVLQGAMASSERIFALLDTEARVVSPGSDASRPRTVPTQPTIRFEHVTFGYVPGEVVLRDVSFVVEPGQTAALVGTRGSGKTTMAGQLAEGLPAVRVRTDVERLRLRASGAACGEPYSVLETARVYARVEADLAMALDAGFNAIADEIGRAHV